jgi:hypothetical protein
MAYVLQLTATQNGKTTSHRTMWHGRSAHNIKKKIQMTFPFGSWFVQRLFKNGKVLVQVVNGEHYVDENLDSCDLQCLYEIKAVSQEDVENLLKKSQETLPGGDSLDVKSAEE